MSNKPWLRHGLTLEQRIALGLPAALRIILPADANDEACRAEVSRYVRNIAAVELHNATFREMRSGILAVATKVREAREALATEPFYWSQKREVEGELEHLVGDIEAEASSIPTGRGGGSHQAHVDRERRGVSAFLAADLLVNWGRRGRPTTTAEGFFVQLAEVMFEMATGNRGNLVKAVKDFAKTHGD
jgi:hypothetical protein